MIDRRWPISRGGRATPPPDHRPSFATRHTSITRSGHRLPGNDMDSHELLRLFEAVRRGEVSPADASKRVKTAPLEETGGFATVDLHRAIRCGSPEVVF